MADQGGARWPFGDSAEHSDVEPSYQAPPPAGLVEFDLGLYRLLVRHYSRAGSIPHQETLAEEMGVSVPTVKRSIRRLRDAGWLVTSRRPQRNTRRGGRLLGGNRYHPKVSLNDLPEEVFPQVATRGHSIPAARNEGSRPKAAKPQVATRDHDGSRSLVGVEERQHQPSSQRGITGSESPASTPTVSESKPVPEGVSLPAALEVGRQRELMRLDYDPTAEEVLATLRAGLGEVEVVQPPSPTRPSPSYRPQRGRRDLPLAGDLDDFHAAVDRLEADTVPESYARAVQASKRRRTA